MTYILDKNIKKVNLIRFNEGKEESIKINHINFDNGSGSQKVWDGVTNFTLKKAAPERYGTEIILITKINTEPEVVIECSTFNNKDIEINYHDKISIICNPNIGNTKLIPKNFDDYNAGFYSEWDVNGNSARFAFLNQHTVISDNEFSTFPCSVVNSGKDIFLKRGTAIIYEYEDGGFFAKLILDNDNKFVIEQRTVHHIFGLQNEYPINIVCVIKDSAILPLNYRRKSSVGQHGDGIYGFWSTGGDHWDWPHRYWNYSVDVGHVESGYKFIVVYKKQNGESKYFTVTFG